MPFKSKAQQRFFYANKKKLEADGVDVEEWSDETDFKHLPERAGAKHKAKRHMTKTSEFWATEFFGEKSAAFRIPQIHPHIPIYGDIAGLGILAGPSVYGMATGEEASPMTKNIAEVGGLGLLAATQVPHLTGMLAH